MLASDNQPKSVKFLINILMTRCHKDLLIYIVHRLTVVGQDDVVAPVQSNKCPSPLFPLTRLVPPPPFHFPNNQSICASGQCEQCGQCDARVSCPRICDGLYREIGQDANPAKTSKRGEAGVQERSRFHFQSFQYFAKQEKEEETS